MVVGGGIAGMQASLDLADQGFKVYLVEEKSAIGGAHGAVRQDVPDQRLRDVQHQPAAGRTSAAISNIEILTDTDVLGVAGQAGNFTVSVRRRPRYIDVTKCVGCGDCAAGVSRSSLPDLYEEQLEGSQGRVSTVRSSGAVGLCDRQTRRRAVS